MRPVIVALFFVASASGCIVVNTTPQCSDGFRNGNESDVDCGGSCAACADGRRCYGNGDCASGACIGGFCGVPAAGCSDGMRNGSETDIDCGGQCGGCADGRQCAVPSDCASGRCEQNVCVANTCTVPAQPAFSGNFPLVNIVPGGAATIPQNDLGFAVTSNGQGGYRVVWTDTLGDVGCFQGILRTYSTFDTTQTQLVGAPQTAQPGANEIRFASVPRNNIDGIDVVTTQAPPLGQADLYLEAFVNGSTTGFNVYAAGSAAPVGNPVAFTSP